MIRILHIVHALTRGGGLSNFVMNYYRLMDRSKVQFDFVYFRDSEVNFREEIESLGGKCYKWTEPALDFRYRKEAAAFFAVHAGEYAALHCHALFAVAAYADLARKHGIPNVIAHSHNVGYGQNGLLRKLRNAWFVRACRHASTHKMACSDDAADFMFGAGTVASGNVMVLPNAIDCEKFFFVPSLRQQARNELGISSQFVVGHVGGFAHQKNHRFLVRLFNEFQKRHSNSLLLLLGGGGIASGSTLNDIKNLVSTLGLSDKVRFVGIRQDVNRLMMAMDAFLFPSTFEGFGLVLVEAQASGLSCLASTNVPRAAQCSPLVEFLPLSKPDQWIDKLEAIASTVHNRAVKPSLFDKYNIKLNAHLLENFYLGLNWHGRQMEKEA